MYITSLLVAMERSLSCPPKNGWEKVSQNQVFELLHTVFCTLTAALRYEPANSHFFKTEIQYEKLADAVRFLGCFSDLRKISAMNVFPSNTQPFQRLLEEEAASVDSVSPTLRHCSKLFIYLYKVATDSFDRYGPARLLVGRVLFRLELARREGKTNRSSAYLRSVPLPSTVTIAQMLSLQCRHQCLPGKESSVSFYCT